MIARFAPRAAAVALVVALSACGSPPEPVPPPSQNAGTTMDLAVPADIANIPLTTASGKTVTLADFRGRAVMIADFMTLCTDICPLISVNADRTAQQVEHDGLGAHAVVLEVSIDPQRDTVARLRAYQRLYGTNPDWLLARTTPADTRKFWHFFRLWFQKVKEGSPPDTDWWTHRPLTYDVDHQDAVYFLDGTGRVRFLIQGSPNVQGHHPPTRMASFLTGQGRRQITHPARMTSWTVPQAMSVFSWLFNRKLASS